MSFPPASVWADLMPHSITVAPLAGVNDYGEEIYSTGSSEVATYTARVSYKPTRTLSFQGEEVISAVTVTVASTTPINATDLVTLPDGSQPPLISVSQHPGPEGLHHQTLMMGRG
jgi:hypothetical protein